MAKENVITKLPAAFPSKGEALAHLKKFPEAYAVYCELSEENREDFLGFCAGQTGLCLCYDTFFHHVFNAYTHRNRVERLLSALLGQEVRILDVLPREGTLMTDRGHLVIMDMVVELEDGSIINLEMQKAGYDFPAERLDCYNADLIIRDYNRKKEKYGKSFDYDMLSPVISIVLMENSPRLFKEFKDIYIHHGQMQWDSGIGLTNLSRQIYVALDIFGEVMHNKDINTPLEAWLTALSSQDIGRIGELIEKFPDFADIYREIFEFRTQPEELIHMYSKALAETDRIAEKNMIIRRDEEIRKLSDQIKQAFAQHEQDVAQHEQDQQTIADLLEEIRLLKERK